MKKQLSLLLILLMLAAVSLSLASCGITLDPSETTSGETTPPETTPPVTTTGGSGIGEGADPGIAGDDNWTERY